MPFRVPEAGDEPELPGLLSGVVELVAVLLREVDVLVAVHDQQRGRRDHGSRLRGRHGVGGRPAMWGDPRRVEVPGKGSAQAPFRGEVHAAHRLGAPVVPAPGAAHGDHRVDAAAERRLPQHHAPAHREPNRRHPLVAELASVPDGHVQVADLLVAERGQAARPAMAAEVEQHHAGRAVEPLGDIPHQRALPRLGEAMCHDDRDIPYAGGQRGGRQLFRIGYPERGKVHGVDRDAVLGDQRGGHDDRLHGFLS